MVYLDSCVLIYWLEGAAPLKSRIVEVIRAATGEVFCISDLVRLECLVGPIRKGHGERKAAFVAQLPQAAPARTDPLRAHVSWT